MGDCNICKLGVDNSKCIGYVPVNINEYEVEEPNERGFNNS